MSGCICRARCPLMSSPIPAINFTAYSAAGCPTSAPSPAEWTVNPSCAPGARALSSRLSSASAIGLRQILPVQTTSMCLIIMAFSSAAVKDAIPCICAVAVACRIVVSCEADNGTFNTLRLDSLCSVHLPGRCKESCAGGGKFAGIYREFGLHGHNTVEPGTALYFSMVTWTTPGYGDFQPARELQLLALSCGSGYFGLRLPGFVCGYDPGQL